MRWKLGILVLVVILLLALPFVAIPPATVKVTVNFPHGMRPATPQQLAALVRGVELGGVALYAGLVLGVGGWVGRRIVRRGRIVRERRSLCAVPGDAEP